MEDIKEIRRKLAEFNPLAPEYDRLTGNRTARHIAATTFKASKDRSVMARLRAADMIAEHMGYKVTKGEDADHHVTVEVVSYGKTKEIKK